MSEKTAHNSRQAGLSLDDLLSEAERNAEACLPGGAVVLLGTKPRDEAARQEAMADYMAAKTDYLRARTNQRARYRADPEYQSHMLNLVAALGSYYKSPTRAGEAMMRLARPPKSVKPARDKGAERVVARMLADPTHFGSLLVAGAPVPPSAPTLVPPPNPERLKTIINSLLAIELKLDRN